jgi:hypothetical protein
MLRCNDCESAAEFFEYDWWTDRSSGGPTEAACIESFLGNAERAREHLRTSGIELCWLSDDESDNQTSDSLTRVRVDERKKRCTRSSSSVVTVINC